MRTCVDQGTVLKLAYGAKEVHLNVTHMVQSSLRRRLMQKMRTTKWSRQKDTRAYSHF